MRRLGDAFDRAEAPVPLARDLGHRSRRAVELLGIHPIQHLAPLLSPDHQTALLKHHEMLRDGLA